MLKTFGYYYDMIDPKTCGQSSGDLGREDRQAVRFTAAVSSPPLLALLASTTAGSTESNAWRFRVTGRRLGPLTVSPVDHLPNNSTTTVHRQAARSAAAVHLPLPQHSLASPFDLMYGQKQVSMGSISPPIIGSAVAATVGTILAQTSPILACDSRPADLFSNKPLTAGLNPSTVDLHATLVVCNDQNGDPNAQLRDGTLISSVRSPIGGLVPVPNVQMSNVQMSNESNGTMSVSVCNTDTSMLSISPHESTLGCPPCIFIKNQDQEPKAPPDTALTGNKVDTFISRQRGGGGEDQHEHHAAVSKPAISRGEIEPNIALGTPPGIQTGAKAAMSRLYQHLTRPDRYVGVILCNDGAVYTAFACRFGETACPS